MTKSSGNPIWEFVCEKFLSVENAWPTPVVFRRVFAALVSVVGTPKIMLYVVKESDIQPH